ncbi:hypothetical protein LCGC14_0896860 [marine sediment metagenome]|uniref:Uncharacterized protein n=1 Tax=marine sediment metagenome TaxID=412755 RepID=A0A0F9RGN7_9ZZZZ
MILYLITGLAVGIIIGAILGYKFAISILSEMVTKGVVKPEALNKTIRKMMGKQQETKVYSQMTDKESIKVAGQSVKNVKDNLDIEASASEREDDEILP